MRQNRLMAFLRHNEQLMEKIRESLASVLPITAIVLAISVTVAPLTPGSMVLFLFGAILLVVGMGLFSLGVDMSMIPMGDGIGVQISRARRVGIPLVVCFVLGAAHNGWLVLGLYLGYSLLRRATEPALLGTNLGVSPLASLVGMFVGMRLGGVAGLILGPIVMMVLVSAVRSHLFDGVARDARIIAACVARRWHRDQKEERNAG